MTKLTAAQKEYFRAFHNNGIHPLLTGGKAKKRYLKAVQDLVEENPQFNGKNIFDICDALHINLTEIRNI